MNANFENKSACGDSARMEALEHEIAALKIRIEALERPAAVRAARLIQTGPRPPQGAVILRHKTSPAGGME